LIGVTVHTGTADGGHYYAFVRDRTTDKVWSLTIVCFLFLVTVVKTHGDSGVGKVLKYLRTIFRKRVDFTRV
jgi:hypothetical protein